MIYSAVISWPSPAFQGRCHTKTEASVIIHWVVLCFGKRRNACDFVSKKWGRIQGGADSGLDVSDELLLGGQRVAGGVGCLVNRMVLTKDLGLDPPQKGLQLERGRD